MDKNTAKKDDGLTLSEMQQIIEETIKSLQEGYYDDDFSEDDEIDRIKKNWGGELEPEEEFDAMEFFGDAGDAAEADIRAEFGDDEFAPFGTMEDPRMLKGLKEGDEMAAPGLFKPKDSAGNDINLKALVTNLDGSKKGRVLGFGDDGQGSLIVRVDWQFPIDMKYMAPKEMGEKREKPEDLIVQGLKEGDGESGRENLRAVKVTYENGDTITTSMAAHLTDDEIYDYFKPGKVFNIGSVEDNMQAVKNVEIIREMENINETKVPETLERLENLKSVVGAEELADLIIFKMEDSLANAIIDDIEQDYGITSYEYEEEETLDESGRGLGKGVKNSGDRNVKMRDDHHSAPLTNLNESLDKNIKTLMEGSITKKELKKFISEQARNLANQLKG